MHVHDILRPSPVGGYIIKLCFTRVCLCFPYVIEMSVSCTFWFCMCMHARICALTCRIFTCVSTTHLLTYEVFSSMVLHCADLEYSYARLLHFLTVFILF